MSNFIPEDFGIETDYRKFIESGIATENNLRETISELYDVKKEEIVFTTGGSEAIFIAALYFRSFSKRALIPVPEYEPMFRAPFSIGTKTFLVEPDEIGSTFNHETDHVMMSNPNNPTGDGKLSENIKEILETNPEKLFIDEAFKDFLFSKKPYTFQSDNPNLIASTTMTKFYGAGFLRLGWIFADKTIAKRIYELKMLTSGSLPIHSMWIGNQILQHRDLFVKNVKRKIS
ncbi:aminotransferase class I and II, partial [mine drainage metagenome]